MHNGVAVLHIPKLLSAQGSVLALIHSLECLVAGNKRVQTPMCQKVHMKGCAHSSMVHDSGTKTKVHM